MSSAYGFRMDEWRGRPYKAAPPTEMSVLLVLIRFVEPGAFAVTIRVADPEPVAAHLNDTPAVPAKAFPAHLLLLIFGL